jgi:hypothetical protein
MVSARQEQRGRDGCKPPASPRWWVQRWSSVRRAARCRRRRSAVPSGQPPASSQPAPSTQPSPSASRHRRARRPRRPTDPVRPRPRATVAVRTAVPIRPTVAGQTRTRQRDDLPRPRRGRPQRARPPAGPVARRSRAPSYHDENRDSGSDRGEKGVAGVLVSNGREVVKTDANGDYRLPAYDGHDRLRHQAGGLGGAAGRAELPPVLLPPPAQGLAAAPLRRAAADRPAAAADQLPDGAGRTTTGPDGASTAPSSATPRPTATRSSATCATVSSTTSPSGTTSASAARSSSVTWPATTSASTRASRRS